MSPQRLTFLLSACSVLSLLAPAARAAIGDPPLPLRPLLDELGGEAQRARELGAELPLRPALWAELSPEQREQLRRQIRDQFQYASPEERQKLREEKREQFERMSPEEKQQMRQQLRERFERMPPEEREARRQHWDERREPGGGEGPRRAPPGR
jgi:hypothetical protein